MNNNWSRRRFTKAIVSAQALIASGVLMLPTACNEEKNIENILLPEEQDILKITMDELIPSNGTMPSASEVGGVDYVLGILKELKELTPLFKEAIATIKTISLEQKEAHFTDLNKEDRIRILTRMENTSSELFNILKDFTYESYYTNETIHELIGYIGYSTGSAGPAMEPFDEKLLDRIKSLPPLYTKI